MAGFREYLKASFHGQISFNGPIGKRLLIEYEKIREKFLSLVNVKIIISRNFAYIFARINYITHS